MKLFFLILVSVLIGSVWSAWVAPSLDYSDVPCGTAPEIKNAYVNSKRVISTKYHNGTVTYTHVIGYACYDLKAPVGNNEVVCRPYHTKWTGDLPQCPETPTTTPAPHIPYMGPYKGQLYGPQCRLGVCATHTLCLNDSNNLFDLEKIPTKEVLDSINKYRANVKPKAKALPELKYDDDLAATAERWAAQCMTRNDKKRYLPYRDENRRNWWWVGQSMFLGHSNHTWSHVINTWAKERENWEYEKGKLKTTVVVADYTQLISADTLFVGCGKAQCNNTDYKFYWVCNFGPGGNLAKNGVDPYKKPYQPAPPSYADRISGDVLAGGLYGPQCRYGVKNSHTMCRKDSPHLVKLTKVPVKEVLDRHNYWRNNVNPRPKFMNQLKWDDDLAVTAERWAARCGKSGHDNYKKREIPDRGDKGDSWWWVGQNIVYDGGYDFNWTIGIDIWADERVDWEYGKGQVGHTKQMITHYTQMIWNETKYVGCGRAECDNDWKYIMVCNYGPGGNIAPSGTNPLKQPYEADYDYHFIND